MRHFFIPTLLIFSCGPFSYAQEKANEDSWRNLPLITDSKIDPHWMHIGYGGFVVDNGSLRTEGDEKGLGLLLYKGEAFGNCQIRVIFRAQDSKSNAGVYVRIDPQVLERAKDPGPPMKHENGKLSKEMLKQLEQVSEKELGAWYPVHHGYEIQICDAADDGHRTGAVYSLAKAATSPAKQADMWRTMIITLKGNLVFVEIDGKQVTSFDPSSKNIPPRQQWYEPKREHQRPEKGYIGLQNHDPGDVVYFKEVSVRPL